jgi:hypothetical protein
VSHESKRNHKSLIIVAPIKKENKEVSFTQTTIIPSYFLHAYNNLCFLIRIEEKNKVLPNNNNNNNNKKPEKPLFLFCFICELKTQYILSFL